MAFRLVCFFRYIFCGTKLRFFCSCLNNCLFGGPCIISGERISYFLFGFRGFDLIPKILFFFLILSDHLINCKLSKATSTLIHRVHLFLKHANDTLLYFLLTGKGHWSLQSAVVGLKSIEERKVVVSVGEEGRSGCYWYSALGKWIFKGVIHYDLDSLDWIGLYFYYSEMRWG